VGGHSLQDESNGNGEQLINFAVQQQVECYFHTKVYIKEHGDHQMGEQLTREIMY
jgi:hypothetical protein